MHGLFGLIGRFRRDERGVFAVIFGLMAIVVVALSGAVVDYVALEQTRSRSQIALDAATLALQPEIFNSAVTDEDIRARAEALIRDRINDAGIIVDVDTVRATPLEGSLFLSARLTVPTSFVGLVGVPTLSAVVRSEAVRGSMDMEIAVALDVTGSMSGSKIETLKTSMEEFIKEVVKDVQSPNTSKMALIPYSQAVNAGSYAEALRGPVRGPKPINAIEWSTGSAKSITGATRANPVTITANGHGFANDDWVYIWNVSGMTQINTGAFQVANRTSNSFQLKGEDGSRYSNYSRNGSVIKCLHANCAVKVTSNNHGYSNDEYVHVTNVGGLTGINGRTFRVSNVTTNTLMLNGALSSGSGNYVSNTGNLHCTWQNSSEGCSYYRFISPNGNENTFPITTCVTERATNGATDIRPSDTYVGRNYPPSGNPCLVNPIVPLTSDKAALTAAVKGLKDVGSTSGSLGVLWAWYMLAPNFGYVWPFDSHPEPYRREELLKAAIIMTDGEFNTVHYDGAIARNSTSGSGSTNDHIRYAAHNGDPYEQARAYCNAMKAPENGISVYTVSFDIAPGSPAHQFMQECASSPENALTAGTNQQLLDAFRQIARRLSAQRLAQ